ncbi:MAG: HEPN domain-containing protein [bacterium]|nr:HEPN domain-containing protein [bacterium]
METIEQLLDQEHLTNIIVFHAQQAVEKTFKGVIEEFALGFVKTHDLVRLYELVKPHYALVDDIEMLEQLDAAYTESRYPDNVGFFALWKALRWRS